MLDPIMEYIDFGNTDLSVSRVGLGCGGYSRFRLAYGSKSAAREVIKHALNLGINFYDTARIYGTKCFRNVLLQERALRVAQRPNC